MTNNKHSEPPSAEKYESNIKAQRENGIGLPQISVDRVAFSERSRLHSPKHHFMALSVFSGMENLPIEQELIVKTTTAGI
jgi:hypothetical protein